jgi:hypothetical protein
MAFNASYLAGLFDGEGCIFIARRDGSKSGKFHAPSYNLSASINMVHRPLIEALASQLECNIITHKKDLKNPKHRRAYEVSMSGIKARRFLLSVYEDLIVKKEEARLAIMFQDHMTRFDGKLAYMSASDLNAIRQWRENIRLQVKALKKGSFLGASDWNADEFGGHPMPDLFGEAEGQYRAKQELTTPGVCNEQVSAPKGKICSALHGNMQNAAEMPASYDLRIVSNK